jgi:hypothetical protein
MGRKLVDEPGLSLVAVSSYLAVAEAVAVSAVLVDVLVDVFVAFVGITVAASAVLVDVFVDHWAQLLGVHPRLPVLTGHW